MASEFPRAISAVHLPTAEGKIRTHARGSRLQRWVGLADGDRDDPLVMLRSAGAARDSRSPYRPPRPGRRRRSIRPSACAIWFSSSFDTAATPRAYSANHAAGFPAGGRSSAITRRSSPSASARIRFRVSEVLGISSSRTNSSAVGTAARDAGSVQESSGFNLRQPHRSRCACRTRPSSRDRAVPTPARPAVVRSQSRRS